MFNQHTIWHEEFFKPGKKQFNPFAHGFAAQQLFEKVEPWSAGAAGYRINIAVDGDYEQFFTLINKPQHITAAQAYCADKQARGQSTVIERNIFNSGSILAKEGLSEDNFVALNAKGRLAKILYRMHSAEYEQSIHDVFVVLEYYGRSVYDEAQGEANPLLQTFTWKLDKTKIVNTEPKVWSVGK